jgi:hypothetical protein
MNARELAALTAALTSTAKTAGKALDEFTLGVYLQRLEPFDLGRVIPLLEEGVERAKLPTARELLDALEGRVADIDEDQEVAGRIIAAIPRFGSYRSKEALEFIGEVGTEVVKRFGGWAQICEVTTDQLGTLRAQLRDSSRGIRAMAKAGRLDRPPELPKPHMPVGLTSAANLLAGVLPGR